MSAPSASGLSVEVLLRVTKFQGYSISLGRGGEVLCYKNVQQFFLNHSLPPPPTPPQSKIPGRKINTFTKKKIPGQEKILVNTDNDLFSSISTVRNSGKMRTV